MKPDMLEFLVAVHTHLAGARIRYTGGQPPADLQAVERTLPDCDWFELEETRDARETGAVRWDVPEATLQF